jgi:hypothetical protein
MNIALKIITKNIEQTQRKQTTLKPQNNNNYNNNNDNNQVQNLFHKKKHLIRIYIHYYYTMKYIFWH